MCVIEKNLQVEGSVSPFLNLIFVRFYAEPVWKYCVEPISNGRERVLTNRSAHQIYRIFLDGIDRFPMGLQEVLCMFWPLIEFFSLPTTFKHIFYKSA